MIIVWISIADTVWYKILDEEFFVKQFTPKRGG